MVTLGESRAAGGNRSILARDFIGNGPELRQKSREGNQEGFREGGFRVACQAGLVNARCCQWVRQCLQIWKAL